MNKRIAMPELPPELPTTRVRWLNLNLLAVALITHRHARHSDCFECARFLVSPRVTSHRTAYAGPTGSYDAGEGETTNIHVSNLPPTVTELSLGDLFARLGGPVGSVKIMWPRLEGVPSNNLGGFVAMMKRDDADRAFEAIDNLDWYGNKLNCTWGKPMPLPARPAYSASLATASPRHWS